MNTSSLLLGIGALLICVIATGCTKDKVVSSAPTMDQTPGSKEDWVDVAIIGANDAEGGRLLGAVLDQAGIKHGFHGSRAYALSVEKQKAQQARALIRETIAKIPGAAIIPER